MSRVEKGPRPLVALALATVFGVGYVPLAPGTCGSAVGLLLWRILPASGPVQATAIAALFALGSWSGSVAERHLQMRDPAPVVIDEVMGMLVTLFLNPVGWVGAIGAFLLFRIADVVKPFPANRLEQLPGGIGVMADDAMAGLYANLVLRALLALGNQAIW
jgi:phosphatidylglycerophosphatase A